MIIMALKPGHDGAVAAIEDGKVLFSIEGEKDSFKRYAHVLPGTILAAAERIGAAPDVVAHGGWYYQVHGYGVDYHGPDTTDTRTIDFFGRRVRFFSSSHVRSHIYGALGMCGDLTPAPRTVLVWEGEIGSFYHLNNTFTVTKEIPVIAQPGARYGMVYAIADPNFPLAEKAPRHDYAGKLMALAAYGDPYADRDPHVREIAERLVDSPRLSAHPKTDLMDTKLCNAGVESQICKDVAAVVSRRVFEAFAKVAERSTVAGTSLLISGGCGLNCDWNSAWRSLGHFSWVFVPPCPNDSGSALGTAVDAWFHESGAPFIEWSVYSGLEFQHDTEPPADAWRAAPLDPRVLAAEIADGAIVPWVQGRWEIGPRALGNRSLLAEPFSAATRDKLNHIKRREDYRPIAPCVRVEDLHLVFDDPFHDPYMLYFRRVIDPRLRAVTHVDGSARAQSVSASSNPWLHALLNAFAGLTGIGVLCNTSLNGKGLGFINRMSDLLRYVDAHGIDQFVVGNTWFRRYSDHASSSER